MKIKKTLCIILALLLILGLTPGSVFAKKFTTGKDEPYVYTAEDRAELDRKIFARIGDVVETARKRIGPADELNDGKGRSRTVLTEEDYIALIPEVIETIKSSGIYVEGSLQQKGVSLSWETTLGMPCCYDPWMEAQLDAEGFRKTLVPGEEVMAAEKELPEQSPKAEVKGGTHYSTSKEIALIMPFWESATNYEEPNHGTFGRGQDTVDQWEALCEEYGSSKTYHYAMATATVDNIAKAIEECAYVAFHSHGITDYNDGKGDRTSRANCSYICLTATDGITSEDTAAQIGPFGTYHHAEFTDYGAMVSGTCVVNHMSKRAPGNYIHLGMCLGMATDGLCRPLRNAGAEAVLGFSQTVKTDYDGDFIRDVMTSLGEGSPLSAAVQHAKDTLGRWDCSGCTTVAQAQADRDAFPIVVSSEDPYPGHGNVDNVQDVQSTWCLYEPGTRDFLVASDIYQVGLTRSALIPGESLGAWAIINGEYTRLPTDHLGLFLEVSNDETDWSNPGVIDPGDSGTFTFHKGYIGYWVRGKITSINQDGHTFTMYTPKIKIAEKLDNLATPVPPEVSVHSFLPYLKPVAGQDYLITTSPNTPTEAEWANRFTSSSETEISIQGRSTANSLNYIYTRFSETDSFYAGENVVSSVYWYGLAMDTLKATQLKVTLAATPYTTHTDGFYATDILKVDVLPVPSSAPFEGFAGSTWMYPLLLDEDYGIFYEDLACTTKLKADTKYKTVYLKLLKATNWAYISCGTTSTLGCLTWFDVADINGRYTVDKVKVPEYSVQIGTLVAGLPFTYSPEKADYYVEQLYTLRNTNAAENGTPGTEPVITFHADGTMTVDTNPCEQAPYSLRIYDRVNGQVGTMRIWVGDFDTAQIEELAFREEEVECYSGRMKSVDLQVKPDNGTGLLTWKITDLDGLYYPYATVNGPQQTNGNTSTAYVTVSDYAPSGDEFYVCAACGVLEARCRVTVLDPPAITSQPQDVICHEGELVSYTVEATGDDLSYQWYFQQPGTSFWVPCKEDSAKTSTYMRTASLELDGYRFSCWINGGMEITWDATLTVIKAIDKVEITIPAPMAGAWPSFTPAFPDGAFYQYGPYEDQYYKSDVAWYDKTTGKYLKQGEDRFVRGHVYRLEVYLEADYGYEFPESISGTVNGHPAEPVTYHIMMPEDGLSRRGFTYTFSTLPAEGIRIYGSDRYLTAMNTADYMRMMNSGRLFENIVVAYGSNFPDALAGSYLAAVTKAPVLLVNAKNEKKVLNYIQKNAAPDATVYLLGGPSLISNDFNNSVFHAGFKPVRLSGADRYLTNLRILEEAEKRGGDLSELLVCSGSSYSDALSTSSVGKPILLVGKKLSDDQKAYLSGRSFSTVYLVGGTGVVSDAIGKAMAAYTSSSKNVKRLGGADRYGTSKLVADEFFSGTNVPVVLVYGRNFPDGLSGGAVAAMLGAPVLLVADKKTASAAAWTEEHQTVSCLILGGQKLISDKNVQTAMNNSKLNIRNYAE